MLNTNNQKDTLELQKNLISNLVEYLNNASTMYYYGNPIINDAEYDDKLKTLENLEKETGYILSSSPTQHAGYIIKDKIKQTCISKYNCENISQNKQISIRKSIKMSSLDSQKKHKEYLSHRKVRFRQQKVEARNLPVPFSLDNLKAALRL